MLKNWLKSLLLINLILSADVAAAAGPIIWGPSGKAQALNTGGIYLKDGQAVITETATQSMSNKTFTDLTLFKLGLKLEDPGVGTNTLTLQSPTLGSSYTLTMPTTGGSAGQLLQTDGGSPTAVLGWASAVTASRADVATSASITALSPSASLIRLTGSTTTALHGITAGTAAQSFALYNVSTADVTVKNQSGSASAANRIVVPGAIDFVLKPNDSAVFTYDDSQARWLLNNNSLLQKANTPSASAYLNSSQTGLAQDADTKVSLDTTEFDIGSYFDTTNHKYLPLVAGKYLITWGITMQSTNTNKIQRYAFTTLRKNGSSYLQGTQWDDQNNGNWNVFGSAGAAVVSFNGTTDYVEVYARVYTVTAETWQINGGQPSSWFTASKL